LRHIAWGGDVPNPEFLDPYNSLRFARSFSYTVVLGGHLVPLRSTRLRR